MFCPKCGNQVADDATHCPACGQSLQENTADEETSEAVALTDEEAEKQKERELNRKIADDSSRAIADISLALGIVSIILSFTIAIFGEFSAAGALVFAIISKIKSFESRKWIAALVVAIVAVVTAVFRTVSFILALIIG